MMRGDYVFYLKSSDNAKLAVEDINPAHQKTVVLVLAGQFAKKCMNIKKIF